MRLSLKRLIAFLLDSLIILAILVITELLFLLYIFFFTNEVADPIAPNIYYISPLSHLTFITIIFGIIHSAVFHGRSAGSTLANIVVISHKKPLLSLIGCVCRSFLIFFIPYIYLYIIVIPYIEKSVLGKGLNEVSIPTLEISILLFLVLIAPISIIWSRGSQSIYDRLLQLCVVCFGKDQQHHELTLGHLTGSILSTAVISMLTVILLQEANYPRLKAAEMHPLFTQMTQMQRVLPHEMFHYFDAKVIKEQETIFWDPAKELLIKSDIAKDVRKLRVSTVRLLSDRKLKDSLIIPANSAVNQIQVDVNGKAVRNPKKVSSAIRDIIEQGKLPCKYLEISVHRDAAFGMFFMSVTMNCYFQKGVGELLDCSGELEFGPLFL